MRSWGVVLGIAVLAVMGGGAACSKNYAEATADVEAGADATADSPATASETGVPPSDASDAPSGPQPTVLASGFDHLSAITATESTVYFADQVKGAIYAVPIEGGMPAELVKGSFAPSALAVAGANLFWADGGKATLNKTPLAGGPTTTVPSGARTPIAMTVAANTLVVALLGTSGLGDVQQYDFDLTPGPTIADVANPFSVAAVVSDYYWSESAGGTIAMGQAGDTSRTVLAPGETDCQSIAADSLGVYWAQKSLGMVRAHLSATPGVVSLATSEAGPFSLAADESGVYWMTKDGKLRRSTRSELPLSTLAHGFAATFSSGQIRALALTTTRIVWITSDGNVLRLDKPTN